MRISQILLLTIILFLTGCNDSNLQNELNYLKKVNNQLEIKLNQLQSLEKELNNIKKNNKDLSVTLAKSELEFSKKYKEEFKKQEESLIKERINIEKNAKLVAEQNAQNQYMLLIGSILLLFLAFIGFSLFKRNEYNKKILDKETTIEKLNEYIVELTKKVKKSKKSIINLELKIKEIEVKAKESSINQVVRKIEEKERNRTNLLNRIEKDLTCA